MRGAWGELIDLAVPRTCPGCGGPPSAGGAPCARCRAVLAGPPMRMAPRVPVGAPVWSCGPYAGPRRAVVLAAKERDDVLARHIMGAVLAAAVSRLGAEGQLAHPALGPPVLVPAPTRASAARARGGDPVAAACRTAAVRLPGASVAPLLRTAERAADSAGLTASGRRANIAGRVLPTARAGPAIAPAAPVLLVDDVVTTGATAAESVHVLASIGVRVAAVVVFSHA